MAEPIKKLKKFVTHNVDGFSDGHIMDLRGGWNSEHPGMGGIHFFACRKTEVGVDIFATIPATPEAMDAHVRIKTVPVHP